MELPTHIVAAGGIVQNEKGQVLLVKHHRHGWVFPGGMIENGESITDGLRREILEETGIDAQPEKLFCVSTNVASYAGYHGVKTIPTKVIMDFTCRYLGGTPRISEENAETEWVDFDDCLNRITDRTHRLRFDVFQKQQNGVCYLVYSSRRNPNTNEVNFTMLSEQFI